MTSEDIKHQLIIIKDSLMSGSVNHRLTPSAVLSLTTLTTHTHTDTHTHTHTHTHTLMTHTLMTHTPTLTHTHTHWLMTHTHTHTHRSCRLTTPGGRGYVSDDDVMVLLHDDVWWWCGCQLHSAATNCSHRNMFSHGGANWYSLLAIFYYVVNNLVGTHVHKGNIKEKEKREERTEPTRTTRLNVIEPQRDRQTDRKTDRKRQTEAHRG